MLKKIKNKKWIIVGLVVATFVMVGSYKFINRTKDLLTSTEWVSKQENSNIIMYYVFSDKQYSLIPEDLSGNELSKDIINDMGITVDITYGKLKPYITYEFEGTNYTFDVKKEGINIILKNRHNKQTTTLTPLDLYNKERNDQIKKEEKAQLKDNKEIAEKNYKALIKNTRIMTNDYISMQYYSSGNEKMHYFESNYETDSNGVIQTNLRIIDISDFSLLKNKKNLSKNYIEFTKELLFSVNIYKEWYNKDFKDNDYKTKFEESRKKLENLYDKMKKENFEDKDLLGYYDSQPKDQKYIDNYMKK